jgi:phosphatidylserine decarboxylase
MATTTEPTPLVAAPITSTQPGGGLGMRLELAWGRWRRAWLRRVRPGYVAAMAAKRRGECPGCPHDVVDPRDLKYFRNVCGYWFREEDDSFRWRARLPLARYGTAELLAFSALFLLLLALFGALASWVHPAFHAGAFVAVVLWIFVVAFFRDPPRRVPAATDVVVSPADGTVTHVGEVDEPDFPGGRAFRVSIFLSVFNVHVNRVPRAGRVTGLRYYPGGFLDARHPECGVRNEQFWVDLEDRQTGRLVRVKQVAGAIARRIVCWLRPGEEVEAGARFGMIKFGSRTDLLVPAGAARDLNVKVGDVVAGGRSVLFRLAPA